MGRDVQLFGCTGNTYETIRRFADTHGEAEERVLLEKNILRPLCVERPEDGSYGQLIGVEGQFGHPRLDVGSTVGRELTQLGTPRTMEWSEIDTCPQ